LSDGTRLATAVASHAGGWRLIFARAVGCRQDGVVPSPIASRPAPQVLEVVLKRLTYVNEETGYTMARVATGRGSDLLTLTTAAGDAH
jgi:hypothetical protein